MAVPRLRRLSSTEICPAVRTSVITVTYPELPISTNTTREMHGANIHPFPYKVMFQYVVQRGAWRGVHSEIAYQLIEARYLKSPKW